MKTTIRKQKPTTFDFVCLACRRVYHHNLSELSPRKTFRCPYCKTLFGLREGHIQILEKKINQSMAGLKHHRGVEKISDS